MKVTRVLIDKFGVPSFGSTASNCTGVWVIFAVGVLVSGREFVSGENQIPKEVSITPITVTNPIPTSNRNAKKFTQEEALEYHGLFEYTSTPLG